LERAFVFAGRTDITPRLQIRSPDKGCGKTTLLDVRRIWFSGPMPQTTFPLRRYSGP
jgi:hypothetical protein